MPNPAAGPTAPDPAAPGPTAPGSGPSGRGGTRPPRAVVMAAIPGTVTRGRSTRTDLSYVPYGRATWQWWCARNGVEFVLLEKPLDDPDLAGAPPPLHRWRAAERLLEAGPPGRQVAVVDADTMIRWDTPDFFALAGGALAAVLEREPGWVVHGVDAYQPFFPGVRLPWREYFNAGLVVCSTGHARLLGQLVADYHRHRAALERVQRGRDVGVDQTLLNFVVRRAAEPVRALPPRFNLVHCLPVPVLTVLELESAPPERRARLVDAILRTPGMFDFVRHAYVWHHNNSASGRTAFMRETWRTIRSHYPGAPELE